MFVYKMKYLGIEWLGTTGWLRRCLACCGEGLEPWCATDGGWGVLVNCVSPGLEGKGWHDVCWMGGLL